MSEADPRLHEALDDLQGYLADTLAPLLVADAVETLLDYPPALTAEQLRIWAFFQFQGRRGATPLSDLLYHAIKKIQQLEVHHLLPAERFARFLAELAGELVTACPPEERERLSSLLRYLREALGGATALVDHLHRAASAPLEARTAPLEAAPALTPDEARDLRRFSLALERALSGPAAGATGGEEIARQLLVLATSGARDSADLEARMARLREAGVAPASSPEAFRSLVGAVPDWAVSWPTGQAPPVSGSLEAVRRAVRLAGGREGSGERWKGLLAAAAEQFNARSFGRAVALLDLAERMVRDGEVDPRLADMALGQAHEAYEITALLEAAADGRHGPTLRRLVELHPAWSVRELLEALVFQPDPKKRRLVIALLEVWGAAARPEGGALLGQLPGHLGAPTLIQRLGEAERSLEGVQPTPQQSEETWKVMNALAAALLRAGSPAARRALLDHTLARRPRDGDSLTRLRDLGRIDLTPDRETVSRLLGALRDLAPRKVLGFVVGRRHEELAHVVRALSGTNAPEVRHALEELTARFPELELARSEATPPATAAEAPTAPETATSVVSPGEPEGLMEETAPGRSSMSGDLEVFGLAGLLQSFQQSETSGRLLLRDPRGRVFAELSLVGGRLASCRAGHLADNAAFFQLFEMPTRGTFEFVRTEPGKTATPASREIVGLLLEAMRRYDELQRLRALVPDALRLRPTGSRPTAPEGETDGDLVRRLWELSRGGASTTECESAVAVDSYRVRSLLAHWLEQNALVAAV